MITNGNNIYGSPTDFRAHLKAIDRASAYLISKTEQRLKRNLRLSGAAFVVLIVMMYLIGGVL